MLYARMAVVGFPSEFSPPTASSRPCSEAHVERITVSASWCHTLGPLANDEFFIRAPWDPDTDWEDWRRAASELVKTDLEVLPMR